MTHFKIKKMPHGNSYGELVLCGIFVIVFLMYFGLLFRKRWYILVPKKGKKMENKRNYEVRKTVCYHYVPFLFGRNLKSGDSASDSVKYLWAGADASGTEDGNCEA